jgi:hypothetical protein
MEELLNTELGSLMAEVQDPEQLNKAMELANDLGGECSGEPLVVILAALFLTVIQMKAHISRVALSEETKSSISGLVSKFKERPRVPAILKPDAKTKMTPKVSAAVKAWKVAFRERVRTSGVARETLTEIVFGRFGELKHRAAGSGFALEHYENLWKAVFYIMFISEDEHDADRVPCSPDQGGSIYMAATAKEAETTWCSTLQIHQEKVKAV